MYAQKLPGHWLSYHFTMHEVVVVVAIIKNDFHSCDLKLQSFLEHAHILKCVINEHVFVDLVSLGEEFNSR